VFIDTDGKPKYKNAQDFMNKWDMPDHTFWEEFFKEAYRVLKYGGRLLSFGIDRQLMLFEYYGVLSGLEIRQSLYWYFISNFPKAADASKNIDKRLKVDRDVVGTNNNGCGKSPQKLDNLTVGCTGVGMLDGNGRTVNISKSNTELGKKYEGYKYSISP
jgi:hypothetical protein